LEDEFAPLARLVEDGEVEPDLKPPAEGDDAELLSRMLVRRHPAPGDRPARPWWRFWG
jgi:hypothetical protein